MYVKFTLSTLTCISPKKLNTLLFYSFLSFLSSDLRYFRIDKLVSYLKGGGIHEENTQWHYKYFWTYIFLFLILDFCIYFLIDNTTNRSVKNTVASLLIETNTLKTIHFAVQSSTGEKVIFSFRYYHEQKKTIIGANKTSTNCIEYQNHLQEMACN